MLKQNHLLVLKWIAFSNSDNKGWYCVYNNNRIVVYEDEPKVLGLNGEKYRTTLPDMIKYINEREKYESSKRTNSISARSVSQQVHRIS